MNGTIYRIENSLGEGVYRGLGQSFIDTYLSKSERHPVPHKDSKLVTEARHLFSKCRWLWWEGDNFVFGFQNIQALKSWFYTNKVLQALHDKGFAVNQYEGEVYHGNTQSVVNTETYKKINSLSLLDLMD